MTDLLITGGTLVDGTGADPVPNVGLLVSGERIAATGQAAVDACRERSDVERIDATGKTVMPGLIDAHTHLTFGEPTGNDELFNHRTEAYSSMLPPTTPARCCARASRVCSTPTACGTSAWSCATPSRPGIVEGPRMSCGRPRADDVARAAPRAA